jgi:hypothetical protein
MASGIRKWGFKIFGVWLLLQGLHELFGLHFDGMVTVMGVLALIAGILIISEN